MNRTKCRLCLCSVDNQSGLFCSVKDETFCAMLKTVFSFPVSSVLTVTNKTYDMPALVCLLCATTVRNFFDFSQKVAAVQKKLEKECLSNDRELSFAELLQLIKTEPVLGEDFSEGESNESLIKTEPVLGEDVSEGDSDESFDMSVDIEAISVPENQTQNNNLRNFRSVPSVQHHNLTSDRTDNPKNCVDTEKVINSIVAVERRVNNVVSRLDILIRKSFIPASTSNSHDTFEFNIINSEEECAAFDANLAEAKYMDKIINWIDRMVGSNDGRVRMFLSVDYFFTRAFFAKCSWTGASHIGERKIAFNRLHNILKLFRFIGTTNVTVMTDEDVYKFFATKLKNARSRMKARGLIRSSMHRSHTRQRKRAAELVSDGV